MLLKIASKNHLHSQFIDVRTGLPVYTIVTRSMFTKPPSTSCSNLQARRGSETSTSSSSSSSSQQELDEKAWIYQLDAFVDGTLVPIEEGNLKHCWILDAQEKVLAELVFIGRTPTAIKIGSYRPILGRFCSTGLFPRADNQMYEFRAATRIDDLEWVVTKSSLELVTSEEDVVMRYHPKSRLDDNEKIRPALLRGSDYLEMLDGDSWAGLREEEIAEILVTFCLMEIFRRGRFKLTPYVFDANTVFDRYHAILRDKYIGAASWKIRQMLGRARSHTL